MRNNKITLFIGGLTGGGAERVTCNLANYLFENGFLVDIITMSDTSDTYKVDDGIKRICLLRKKERVNSIYNYFVRRARLKQYLLDNQDVSCYIVMLPITIFMLVRLKKYTNSKIIISERCNPTSYSFIKRLMMKYSAKRCDGMVVQTEEISKWYKNVKNKITIPNAINRDITFPRRESIEKRIVAVGRIEKQKNYPMLVNAFAIFSKSFPDYKLEIYGKGSQEKNIRNLIAKKQLTDKIKLMGYVDNISERVANATCFVMTSNFEGIPNALIEAMCIGIPCVSTDCDGGGAKALIRSGENGILIKKDDYHLLADKMGKIVSNRHMAKRMGLKATKLKDELSNDYIYDKWLKYILSVSEGDKR